MRPAAAGCAERIVSWGDAELRFARLTGPVRRNGAHRPGIQSVGGVCGMIDQVFRFGDAYAQRVAASQGDSGGGTPLAGGFTPAGDSSGRTIGAERRARHLRLQS